MPIFALMLQWIFSSIMAIGTAHTKEVGIVPLITMGHGGI